MTECMMNLLVYMNVCETLLIVSGCDVELNPGPSKHVQSMKNLCLIERWCVHLGILLELQ